MAEHRVESGQREQIREALGVAVDHADALTNLRRLVLQRVPKVVEELYGGVQAHHLMAAAGQVEDLRSLAAAHVEDPPGRYVRKVSRELPGHHLLPDDLTERPEVRAPLMLAG